MAEVTEPPADLKSIIDKTAIFVARNGPEFETRIRNEQNNAKFSFLQPNDPFHPYYRAKVVEHGGAEASAPAAVAEGAGVTTAAATTQPVKPKAPSITPVEPPKLLHTGVKPVGAAPLDVDVIQLTAQFVALNGRAFLTGIATRESKNPQFDFLKPTNHLFSSFTALVDAYSKCLKPPEEVKESLAADGADSLRTLARVQQYAAYVRDRDREKLTKEQQIEEERRLNMLVDWHDFVVVETISFDDEEALPAPQALENKAPADGAPTPTGAMVPPPPPAPAPGADDAAAATVEPAAPRGLQPVPEHLIPSDPCTASYH